MDLPRELITFLDVLPEPRILVDANYHILAANQAYGREFGGRGKLVGRTCYAVSHHYDRPCDQCGETCPLQTALKTGQPARVLHLHHTPRGEEHVDVELVPLPDDNGQTAYFIETFYPLSNKLVDRERGPGMVGRSSAYNAMLELINRAAPAMTPVLLLGESGTGKELAAQALHDLSARHGKPFVPVDCSGMTESLFESELFGYEKGAFTGATQRKIGLVEAAAGGTLFLDELGDIPLSLQVKLLRLLETGTFRRVGGVETLKADFRLVAATHRGVREMVEAGTFRRDLYYRISAFPIHLPALRERREDMPLLVESLLQRLAPGRSLRLSGAACERLAIYGFPGNIRELRNMLERAVLLCDGEVIGPEHLPLDLAPMPSAPAGREGEVVPLDEAEHRYVRWALDRLGGDKKALAGALGISERTLYRKLGAP
ncbi:MAG: sigma-54-dependent Fis family transcriptional regulator [Gallionellaceae bacterium]|nr:sigma-54-dependent Fis family transcriptional regulator [Gallionellaceae bacterium]